jgi:hypothetical protein
MFSVLKIFQALEDAALGDRFIQVWQVATIVAKEYLQLVTKTSGLR